MMSEKFLVIYTVYGYEDSNTEIREFGTFDEVVGFVDWANLDTEEVTVVRGVLVDTSEIKAVLDPIREARSREAKEKLAARREENERLEYERLKQKYG
jgi:hypothetical protein